MIGLGTRWRFGEAPPPRLPAAAAEAVRRAEAELLAGGSAPDAASWTLTWLEGRPVAELDVETPEGFLTVTLDPLTGEGRLTFEP
ncbi:hypothetical protein [Naasia aerilata]|uniref:PepSY domain-containing protein n=1 Tax=Naasia aerilata TaxID=1162966 RepID=A0ABN6XNU1_9MICO|nr:hypothetical protein [Naasia aerilata]BDZ46554.1 hypothetical protein GCM10025866_24630 [Naasia aerilata]